LLTIFPGAPTVGGEGRFPRNEVFQVLLSVHMMKAVGAAVGFMDMVAFP
jgi:hypothetical protein